MKSFGGIEEKYSGYDSAAILLQSLPYDGTSTWGKGADKSFGIFIEASENMELYDTETDSEVYKRGIHVMPEISLDPAPEKMVLQCHNAAAQMIRSGKFPTFMGGEHSVSIGIIRAFYEAHDNLTVLQLDAHSDLRPEYMGTPFNHACAVHEASKHTNLIQVGIRSMDVVEKPFLNRDKVYFAEDIYRGDSWMQESIDKMGSPVYITLDLDVLDPSVMPATGTPEPGGLDWKTITKYLRMVFAQREVVGFDIVEFAPIEGLMHPGFFISKLYYKMLSYKFSNK